MNAVLQDSVKSLRNVAPGCSESSTFWNFFPTVRYLGQSTTSSGATASSISRALLVTIFQVEPGA